MDAVHANYPFLDASREAVREADLGLAELVTAGGSGDARHPAVERGVQRVERALLDGSVDLPEGQRHPGVQAELLSYPVARVLVSLLDAPGAIDKYATAEARTAHERFVADFETLDDDARAPDDGKVPLRYVLREFDLADRVDLSGRGGDGRDDRTERDDGVAMAVTAYLRLASGFEGERWRLVTRALADGWVSLAREELHELLREAVRQRVADGLPTRVPEQIAAGLTDEVAELEDAFSEIDVTRDIDVLAPERFPPCASGLVERAQSGADLPPHAEFALVSFLASANADDEQLAALTGAETEAELRALRYRAERVSDESGAQYAPPSCATMQAYGECPVADEDSSIEDPRCETISHPLTYYEDALADAE
ncbi:DNA primase large subunit PriL [Halorussus halobius]|uniref:DNA primase large subunit PriL n=1 Tax=Halorussus halobius TaxID=1710537 RepID=UPI0010930132|nr:DNA primase large subunit PriL [Halorussus halobius]